MHKNAGEHYKSIASSFGRMLQSVKSMGAMMSNSEYAPRSGKVGKRTGHRVSWRNVVALALKELPLGRGSAKQVCKLEEKTSRCLHLLLWCLVPLLRMLLHRHVAPTCAVLSVHTRETAECMVQVREVLEDADKFPKPEDKLDKELQSGHRGVHRWHHHVNLAVSKTQSSNSTARIKGLRPYGSWI